MKTPLFAAACLLAVPVLAQERAPELPSMAQLRADLKTAPLPPLAIAAAQATPPKAPLAPAPVLPSTFSLYEKLITITDALELKSGKTSFGKISQRFFALTKRFDWDDAQGNRVAEARAVFFALGSTVDVTDGAGNKIGTIKEEILKSLFKVWTTYRILDASGKQVASSEKVEWLSTEITLKGPDGRGVALLRRGFKENFFRLTDRWDVTVYDAAAVDSRMLVMIAAYKTSVDNDRRREAAAEAARKARESK